MSKVKPTRRSRASSRSSVAGDDEDAGFPDAPETPPKGSGEISPDPIELEGPGAWQEPGDAEVDGPEEPEV